MKTVAKILIIGVSVGLTGAWLLSQRSEPAAEVVVVPAPKPVPKPPVPSVAPCGCQGECKCDPCRCATETLAVLPFSPDDYREPTYEEMRQKAIKEKKHFVAIVGGDPPTWVFQKDVVCVRISRAEWTRINKTYPPYATDGYAVGRYDDGGHWLTFFGTKMTAEQYFKALQPPQSAAPLLYPAPGRSC